MNRWVVLVLISLLLLVVGAGAVGQDLERTSGESTGWWLYRNASAETIEAALDEHGARLIDLEVTSASPLRFAACLVSNSGTYASDSWWYYGIDGGRVSELLDELTARIIDLEVYTVDGQLRFAVILVPNTGAQAKAWWWYYNATADAVSDLAAQHDARLVDVEVQRESGEPLYAFVMIRNTGADDDSWSWYPVISPGDLTEVLSTTPVRILDLERTSDGHFAVVLLRRHGVPWWWWYGMDGSDVAGVLGFTDGGRIVDIEQYGQSGSPRYTGVFTGNVGGTASAPVHESFPIDIVLTTTSDWTDVRFVDGEITVQDYEILAGADAEGLEIMTSSGLSVGQNCCDITPVQVLFHATLTDPSERLELKIEKGYIGETTVTLHVPGETEPIATYKHVGIADDPDPANTRTFSIYCPYITSDLTWILGAPLE